MSDTTIKPSGRADKNRVIAHLQFRKTPPPVEAKVETPAPKPPPPPKLKPKPRPEPRQVEKRETPPEPPEPEIIPPQPSQVAALDPRQDQDMEEELARQEEWARRAREKYFSDIMKKIERMKYYPMAARRRGIQDAVRIGFNVRADGVVELLQVSGQTSILNRAAKEAVLKSSPLPPPPDTGASSMKVEITMKFTLE
ncbi:MAG: energy transducer TonB [Nitrospinota bacterium]|nr:energy transducer TonB [Nitrospinota bacterium]